MDTQNDEEIISNSQEESVDLDTTEEETLDDVKSQLAKAQELANNYKIRAEKAERKGKEPEQKQVTRKESDLSTMDIIALSKANLEQDDVAEVLEYAKFKGISVQEALKSSVVKATIQEKNEMRNTALATNTGGSRRSTGKVSDETLLSNAKKGIMPESDEDMARLIKARRAIK
jgi:hypothetical protein